jgi:hypothetical protein
MSSEKEQIQDTTLKKVPSLPPKVIIGKREAGMTVFGGAALLTVCKNQHHK